MAEPCGWQDKRGNDCARPAVWLIREDETELRNQFVVYSCHVHLADVVKERALEWVGCWVDKA